MAKRKKAIKWKTKKSVKKKKNLSKATKKFSKSKKAKKILEPKKRKNNESVFSPRYLSFEGQISV